MKFRRDWPIIWRDLIIPIVGISIFLINILYIPLYNDGQLNYVLIVPTAVLFITAVLAFYSIGIFSTYIVLNEEGIVLLQRKKMPLTLCWRNITKITRTRYKGGKTLVFEDVFGHKIWLYPTKKIETYIRENHPELDPIFPDKKSYKKWTEIL